VGGIVGEPALNELPHASGFRSTGAIQVSEGRLLLVGHIRVGPGDIVE
jgi:hypothetical protein